MIAYKEVTQTKLGRNGWGTSFSEWNASMEISFVFIIIVDCQRTNNMVANRNAPEVKFSSLNIHNIIVEVSEEIWIDGEWENTMWLLMPDFVIIFWLINFSFDINFVTFCHTSCHSYYQLNLGMNAFEYYTSLG